MKINRFNSPLPKIGDSFRDLTVFLRKHLRSCRKQNNPVLNEEGVEEFANDNIEVIDELPFKVYRKNKSRFSFSRKKHLSFSHRIWCPKPWNLYINSWFGLFWEESKGVSIFSKIATWGAIIKPYILNMFSVSSKHVIDTCHIIVRNRRSSKIISNAIENLHFRDPLRTKDRLYLKEGRYFPQIFKSTPGYIKLIMVL